MPETSLAEVGNPATFTPEEAGEYTPSIWGLVRSHLSGMIRHAVLKASDQFSFREGILPQLRAQLNRILNSSLKHVGYGQGPRNDTVRHEVEMAVSEATNSLNITQPNSTFEEILTETLDQEIELDAFGQIINSSSNTLGDTDFFHRMPIKDETLFVALVCMAIILPIIFLTLLGIFFHKRRQENIQRRKEMLLKDQAEISMDEYVSGEPSDREEDVPDLDLKFANA